MTQVEVKSRPVGLHIVVLPAMLGIALGLGAYSVDSVSGTAGVVVGVLASSALSWGLAAMIAGYLQPDVRSACIAGTTVLVCATIVYYLCVLFVSRRWELGDYDAGPYAGLWSVTIALSFWLTGSVTGGILLGTLGFTVARRATRVACACAGVALGLLAAESVDGVAVQLLNGVPDGTRLLQGVCSIVMAVVIMTLAVRRRTNGTSWPVFLGSALASIVVLAMLWHMVNYVRTYHL